MWIGLKHASPSYFPETNLLESGGRFIFYATLYERSTKRQVFPIVKECPQTVKPAYFVRSNGIEASPVSWNLMIYTNNNICVTQSLFVVAQTST
jgi:hypothetical protein